jgi:hypothetical protein
MRFRIKVKTWIRINVMRIRNPGVGACDGVLKEVPVQASSMKS